MTTLNTNGLGCGSALDQDIVKEWAVPGQHVGLDVWRRLTPKQQRATVEKEVEENGIERPKGYTTSFHYNARVEAHHFGKSHPMKPWRLTLTKQLIFAYGLHYAMDNYEAPMASKRQLQTFHTEEYLSFLER